MKEGYNGHGRSQSNVPLLPYTDSSPPSPFVATYRSKGRPTSLISPRRRSVVVLCAFAAMVGLGLLASHTVSRGLVPETDAIPEDAHVPLYLEDVVPSEPEEPPANWTTPSPPHPEEVEEYSPWVLGPPTQSFRDNLRSDTKYLTSWISAGWNNDVMTYMNMIYLAKITERVPIVAMFIPSHVGPDAGVVTFGEVFDVPRFIEESGTPLVEWIDVKDPASDVVDELGCWNIWEAVQYYEHSPRYSYVLDWLKLDISYTKAPDWIKMIPGYEHDKCSSFWALARLAYPEDRELNIGNAQPSLQHGSVLDPDEHVVCYDYLYYACASASWEWDMQFAPSWRYVGRYLHWTKAIETLVAQYVNRAFGLPDDGPLPEYITIHARHGDFKNWCWEAEDPNDCFAPLPVIARRIREVQDEIYQRKGILIPMSRVIMTSDEADPAWWDEVAAMGWARMDHEAEQTVEKYGKWYPVILDAAIQSLGYGFVGTDRSTFSQLSRRRVMDWQDGAARMVLWGKKGADDH